MTVTRVAPAALCLAVALLTSARAQEGGKDDDFKCRVIYVPTPQEAVNKMLDMAKVTRNDVVFDLGCGDGRVVCTAAKRFGARGIGVDIDPERIKDCMATLKKFEVTRGLVEFRQGDALKVKDLERATVIVLYMLPEFMEKLEKQLDRLKPGTRIVAHDYAFPNVKADQTVNFKGPDREHTLFFWEVKAKK